MIAFTKPLSSGEAEKLEKLSNPFLALTSTSKILCKYVHQGFPDSAGGKKGNT